MNDSERFVRRIMIGTVVVILACLVITSWQYSPLALVPRVDALERRVLALEYKTR